MSDPEYNFEIGPAPSAPVSAGAGLSVVLGWLLPPVWWLTQFQVRYALVPWACKVGKPWSVPAVGLVALVVAGIFFVTAKTRAVRDREDTAKLVGQVGVWSSALFFVLIAAQLLPDLFVDGCTH